MSDKVAAIDVHVVDLSQDRPYLGTLREGEQVDPQGYFVRKQNRTVYPRRNRSLVVRVVTEEGIEGWRICNFTLTDKIPKLYIKSFFRCQGRADL